MRPSTILFSGAPRRYACTNVLSLLLRAHAHARLIALACAYISLIRLHRAPHPLRTPMFSRPAHLQLATGLNVTDVMFKITNINATLEEKVTKEFQISGPVSGAHGPVCAGAFARGGAW